MKKSRVLAILLTVLCSSFVLTSCSDEAVDTTAEIPTKAIEATQDDYSDNLMEGTTVSSSVGETEKNKEKEDTTKPTEKNKNGTESTEKEDKKDTNSKTQNEKNQTNVSSDQSNNKNSKTNTNNQSSNKGSSSNSSSSKSGAGNNSASSSKPNNNNSNNSSTSSKKWHDAEYRYVDHPAVTEKVWVVDQKAYNYEEPVYEYKEVHICRGCGSNVYGIGQGELTAHMKAHALAGENASWYSDVKQVQTGTKTVTVPEKGHYETKVTKEAWTEKILVREAGYY